MDEGGNGRKNPRIKQTDGPDATPFLAILLYVLGFMGALALLALLAAWLLRRF